MKIKVTYIAVNLPGSKGTMEFKSLNQLNEWLSKNSNFMIKKIEEIKNKKIDNKEEIINVLTVLHKKVIDNSFYLDSVEKGFLIDFFDYVNLYNQGIKSAEDELKKGIKEASKILSKKSYNLFKKEFNKLEKLFS